MKEFNSWFQISFSWRGKDIEHIIHTNKVERYDDNQWEYSFNENVKGDEITFVVVGTIDDDNNIRTSGECYVDGNEVMPFFYVEVFDEDGLVDNISDIDIIDSE